MTIARRFVLVNASRAKEETDEHIRNQKEARESTRDSPVGSSFAWWEGFVTRSSATAEIARDA